MIADHAESATSHTPKRLTVTVEEAAQLLGIGRATAYQAVKSGELPTVKIGRRLLVPLQRLEALLAGETVQQHGD